MRVNLLEKDESYKINWTEIIYIIIIIAVLAIPAVNYYVNRLELKTLQSNKLSWQQQLTAIQPQFEYYQKLNQEVSNFKLPVKMEMESYQLSPALREFSNLVPAAIYFDSLNYQTGNLVITGNATTVRSLLDFLANIYNSTIFSVVSLERFQQESELNFKLTVKIDTPSKKGGIN